MRNFNFILLPQRGFLTPDTYEVKIPKARPRPFAVNGAITARGLLAEKSQISYCTATMLVPQ